MLVLEQVFKRREPFVFLTAFVGAITISSFWFPFEPMPFLYSQTLTMVSVISFFMLCLGAISQYLIHVPAIIHRREGWYWDAFFIGSLSLLLPTVLVSGLTSSITTWIVNYMRTPLSLGIGAMYAPYVFRALLKSVTARSIPATLMLVVMVVLLAANAPVLYTHIPGLYEAGDFINTGLTGGGATAFTLTISLVSVVTCIRTLIGREKGYLGK